MKNSWAMLLAGALIFSSCGGSQEEASSEISVPVSVMEVNPKSIEKFIVATGTANSASEITIKSETTGDYHLQKNPAAGRSFALGDAVGKDQVIILLRNLEEENNIRIDSKKLHLETSKLDFEKQKSLYDKGGVTLTELKNAERTYIDAQYDYDNALISLSKLRITAPFDGIITVLPYYTPGTRVAAAQTMVQLMNYRNLYLEVNLPGKDMGTVTAGQPVRVMNYSLPDDTLSGQVTSVSPALDPQSRSFRASISVTNPDLLMRPGMFVKAEIIVARHDSSIVIPKDVVLAKQRGKTVFIVQKGAAQERIITTGLENPDEIEVLEGLKKDDRLVIKGFETLRNRSKVKVIR
ncbi:MAG: efflux RND transporter periplasmic adaptor subunit [Candidatus Krumholzibacteriota bacterium]|nr:efflux RND transporter periplasmic adaptor subunit [Candidatus Krumholzibacteriota bacterium]